MEIILNEVKYIAPAPKTGLWFEIQKNRTAQAKRVAAMQAMLDKIIPYELKEELTDQEIKESNSLVKECNAKIEENKSILTQEKVGIIVKAIGNSAVTFETILEHLPLADVSIKFAEICTELDGILSGRILQFPNEPAAKV